MSDIEASVVKYHQKLLKPAMFIRSRVLISFQNPFEDAAVLCDHLGLKFHCSEKLLFPDTVFVEKPDHTAETTGEENS